VWVLLEPTFRGEHIASIITVFQLLVTANVVPSSLTFYNSIMEATRSSETSALTSAIRRHIPEDDILLNQNIHASTYIHRSNFFRLLCLYFVDH
jgi:hypothetical protein